MDPTEDVPAVDASGVAGTQLAGSAAAIDTDPSPPLVGELLPRTVMGLVADRPSKFGGDLNAPILRAFINDISVERDKAKQLAADRQSQLDEVSALLNEERIKNVKLAERQNESQKSNRMQKICIFLSPILFSIAIDLYKGNLSSLGVLIGIVATVMLLANFLPTPGNSQ